MKPSVWKKILFLCFIIAALGFSFWYGDGSFLDSKTVHQQIKEQQNYPEPAVSVSKQQEPSQSVTEEIEQDASNPFAQIVMHIKQIGHSSGTDNAKGKNLQNSTGANKNAAKATDKAKKKKKKGKKQDSKKAGQPEEDALENAADETEQPDMENQEQIICTVTISCAALLEHMDALNDAKKKLVPENGILLASATIAVPKGSTAFDVLKVAAESNHIQLEYSYTPAYKNYYVEGIGNIYAFDAGTQSGWMYSVNNEFTGYGSSSYVVSEGDEVKWIYTCSFGKDAGIYVEE